MAAAWRMRLVRTGGYTAVLALVLVKSTVERVAYAPPNNNVDGPAVAWAGEVVFLAVMAGYAAVILMFTARRSPALPATLTIGTATGLVLGVAAYLLGPLGFPLRFTGTWPARLYDVAIGLGVLLALALRWGQDWRQHGDPAAPCPPAPVSGRAPWPDCGRGRWPRSSWPSCRPPPSRSCLMTAVFSTGPSRTSVTGFPPPARLPVVHSRLGYVAGNSAFAAGYLAVLLIGPLACCAFAAGGARLRHAFPGPGSR